ncbi:hypothetical protein [Cylindrospermum stagnale]|nr:hypothetical protein [Cylindrospermum stagnale]
MFNFYSYENGIYEFDITQANFPGINRGTKDWVKKCLSIFGIEINVSSWQVIPVRSYYFSSYTEKDDLWEDSWTKGWLIRVFTDSQTPASPIFFYSTILY